MQVPEVSVVIPAYNSSQYIGQAIESVLNQNVNLEIIVVDDGSTDDLDSIILQYKELNNFFYIKNMSNLGVAESRNIGVKNAKGNYIAFLDADDMWLKGKLLAQINLMKENGYIFTYTARTLVNQDGDSLNKILSVKDMVDYNSLLYHNCIACSSVVIAKSVMMRFPMDYSQYHEDYIVWLRILREYGNAYGINEPYLVYRVNKHGKSNKKLKSAYMTFKGYRILEISIYKSMFYTCSHLFHGLKKYYFNR